MRIPILLVFLCLAGCQALAETNVLTQFKDTAVDAFDSTGLLVLAAGTAATLIALNEDQAMHDSWAHHQRMGENEAAFGNFWGTGIPQVVIALGQLLYDRENGIVDSVGLIESTGTVSLLKYVTARERPDHTTPNSFPSGHTQIAFSSATSLYTAYGWIVGVPMFALATYTGLSRLADDAHWLSDVTAGATVGILFGRAGFKSHRVAIQPMPITDGGRGMGAMIQWRFD